MDNVVHLLGVSEHAVLRTFRHLALFRRSYDLRALEPVKAEFVMRFGCGANGVLSQAIVLDRLLMRNGFAQDWLCPDDPRASGSELALLEFIRCGQQSLFNLDRLVSEQFLTRRSDIVSVICRYASLLLSAGLCLPVRGEPRTPERLSGVTRRLIAISGDGAATALA